MSSKFDKWIGEAPFSGRVQTSKALDTLRNRDPVVKDIKLNQRLFILALYIIAHGSQAYIPLPKIQQKIQVFQTKGLVDQNLNKLQAEIIKSSLGIAYSIANLLVTLTQISLFLRLSKIKAENKIKLEGYLTKFGISEGSIDIKDFTEEVLQELKLEPNKRYGLHAITYLLTDKEKLSIQTLLYGKEGSLDQRKQINPDDLIAYLDSSDLEFLDPLKKKTLVQKIKSTSSQVNFSPAEINKMTLVTMFGQFVILPLSLL